MASTLHSNMVRRPDKGRQGRPIKVLSNFFEINSLPRSNFYLYDVKFNPEVPKEVRRVIFEEFVTVNKAALVDTCIVFDGMALLYANKVIVYRSPPELKITFTDPRGGRQNTSDVVIQEKPTVINMEALASYLAGRSSMSNTSPIQLLETVVRYRSAMRYCTVGRSFFLDTEKRSLGRGLEVHQGIYQSAKPTEGKMMLNLDVAATAFWEDGPLVVIAAKLSGFQSPDALRGKITERTIRDWKSQLRGLRVQLTTHQGKGRRIFSVQGMASTASQEVFDTPEDGRTNVEAYFKKKYNLNLRLPYFPCVKTAKGIFPMEVLNVLPRQRYTKKLSGEQTSEMIRFTTVKPQDRLQKIIRAIPLVDWQNNAEMRAFQIGVDTKPATVNARLLNAPGIRYAGQKPAQARFGAWNMKGLQFAEPAVLVSWFVVSFINIPDAELRELVLKFCKGCQEVGIQVRNKPPISKCNPQTDIERHLTTQLNSTMREFNQPVQMFLAIGFDGSGNDVLYQRVKRCGETVMGVPSQYLIGSKMRKQGPQYFANVALKVNAKLGGKNSIVQLQWMAQKPTMVLGIDLSHPSAGERKTRKSVAAMVCSLDSQLTQFASSTRVQDSNCDMVLEVQEMVVELLKEFSRRNNGIVPKRLLLYRDGVGDGQFEQVLADEMKGLYEAFKVMGCTDCMVTYVVVQKRHHARFFPQDAQRDADRSGNCLAGMVIDTGITHPFLWDFYLLSHAGIQGTSRPTHYTVLMDQNKFTSDQLQELTFAMCHTYVRCTRSVSLVSAVFYAHLLSNRIRQLSVIDDSSTVRSGGSGEEEQFSPIQVALRSKLFYV